MKFVVEQLQVNQTTLVPRAPRRLHWDGAVAGIGRRTKVEMAQGQHYRQLRWSDNDKWCSRHRVPSVPPKTSWIFSMKESPHLKDSSIPEFTEGDSRCIVLSCAAVTVGI